MLRFMLIFDQFLINFWWFSIAPTLQFPWFFQVELQFSYICLFAYASLAVTRFGVDFGGFQPSKRPLRGSKMRLGGLLGASWGSLGRLLRVSWTLLGGSWTLLGGSWTLLEAPRASLGGSKRPQEPPKRPQEPPKRVQEPPKRVQEPPKRVQETPKRPTRRPQEAPKGFRFGARPTVVGMRRSQEISYSIVYYSIVQYSVVYWFNIIVYYSILY